MLTHQRRVTTLIGYVLFTVLIGLPERFQLINMTTSQTAGIDLLPYLGSAAVGKLFSSPTSISTTPYLSGSPASGICGWLSREKNRSFYTLTFSGTFIVLGTGLISSLNSNSSFPRIIYLYEVLLGFGVGGTLVSTILMVKLNASEKDAGTVTFLSILACLSHAQILLASAQGLQSQARLLGGNIGLALATIILNIHLNADLKGILTPAQISDLRHSLNAIEHFSPREIAAVAESFAHAFKTQLQVCTGVATASLLFGLMAWQRHPPTFVDLGKTERKTKKTKKTKRGEIGQESCTATVLKVSGT